MGCVKTYTNFKGRRLVIAFYFPGDYFGLEMRAKHHVFAEAVAPSMVRAIGISAIKRRSATNFSTARYLLHITNAELQRAQNHSLLLRSSADERLGQFLFEMKRLNRTKDVELSDVPPGHRRSFEPHDRNGVARVDASRKGIRDFIPVAPACRRACAQPAGGVIVVDCGRARRNRVNATLINARHTCDLRTKPDFEHDNVPCDAHKILFVIPPYLGDQIEAIRPGKLRSFFAFPYGVLCLASYINKATAGAHDIKIVDLNQYSAAEGRTQFAKALADFEPDIVGISVMFDVSYKHVDGLAAAAKAANPDAKVMLGGAAVTTAWNIILQDQPMRRRDLLFGGRARVRAAAQFGRSGQGACSRIHG